MSEKTLRRRADAQNAQGVPVRLVIYFVGAALILSLLIYAVLRYLGQDTGDLINIILPCITGLIGLLGRTSPQEAAGPSGTAAEPINIAAPPNAPVNVTETPAPEPKDDAPVPGTEPVDLDDDGGDDLTADETATVKP